MTDHIKSIVKLFEAARYNHDLYTLFSDWCECAALLFSNFDLRNRDRREARYREIVKNYDRKTLEIFPQIMNGLVEAFEAGPTDVLGQVFHALELHNKTKGQFFTPYHLCELMAKMTVASPDELRSKIEERGFIRAQEPAVGAGAMVIALAQTMREAGFNYQQHLHVTAIDIDRRAVHMAYVQFSLMHIPAVVIEGDTLRMEFRDEWYTGAHILGGWGRKLRSAAAQTERPRENDPCLGMPENPRAIPSVPFTIDKRGQFSLF